MDVLAIAGFLLVLALWFFGIWLGYEERRRHRAREGHSYKTSSDPSLIR